MRNSSPLLVSEKQKTEPDYSDLFDKEDPDAEVFITSAIAQERGIRSSCGDAPPPVPCKYCGKQLYFTGWMFPPYGRDRAPHIFRWSDEPERCDCPDAVKYWAEYDAEVERKKQEEAAARERKRHKAAVEKLLSQSGICKRFQQRTFETFKQDTAGRKRAYEVAKDYADSFDKALETGEGLYIEGTFGTGKTHLAAAIGMFLTEKEYSVVMKTSFDLFEEIKKSFDGENGTTEHKVMEAYKKCDLLIIDDLGKEQCTDWSMSVLYSIVNYRYEAMKPIVITTNFNNDDLIQTLTPKGFGSQKIKAIMSRLMEVSKVLTMAWADYRRS